MAGETARKREEKVESVMCNRISTEAMVFIVMLNAESEKSYHLLREEKAVLRLSIKAAPGA